MSKTALVTGAAKNLGKNFVLYLAKQGYNILLQYNNSETNAQIIQQQLLEQGVNCELLKYDLADTKQLNQFIQQLQKLNNLDILINNVGPYIRKPITQTSTLEFNKLWQLNVSLNFTLVQQLTPQLLQSNALVINIGCSGVSNSDYNPVASAYHICKAALWQQTKALSLELAPAIRLNMISPGHLEHSVDAPQNIIKSIPMQRLATSNDIMLALQYLIDSTYITGQNLDVTGGFNY